MPNTSKYEVDAAGPRRAPDNRLALADGLRGIAALWVVLFHLSEGHHIDALKARLPELFVAICFDLGHLGVAIFFVLSGFVMALTADKARVDARYAGRFLLRRVLRLTPPYYFAIAFSVLVLAIKAHALGQTMHAPGPKDLLAHAFYLQDLLGVPEISVVFWTLCIEVQFYIAFALILWLADAFSSTRFDRQIVRTTLLAGAALIALGWPMALVEASAWPGGFPPLWYAFLMGVFAFSGWRYGGYRLAMAGIYALALGAIALTRHDEFAATAALTCAVLLLSRRGNGMTLWLSPRPFQFVGLISYSLYLLHNPLTGMSFRALHRLLPAPGAGVELVGAVVTVAVCVAAAWICFRLVERPSIAWSHSVKLKGTAPL